MTACPTEPLVGVASRLAASGDLQAALAVLSPLEEAEPSASVLLLKAKILAQQRRYAEAIDSWNKVLESQPESSEARDGIRRARKASRGLGKIFCRYSLAFQAMVAVAALGAAAAAVLLLAPWPLGQAAQTAPPATADATADQVVRVNERIDRLEAALVPLQASAAKGRTPTTDTQVLRAEIGDLAKLFQTRSAEIQDQVVKLREQLAQTSDADTTNLAVSRTDLDQLAGRVAAVETRTQGNHAQLSAALDESRRRLDRLRCEQLIWWAFDLSSRGRLKEQDLDMLVMTGEEILAIDLDERSRDYARRLIRWAKGLRAKVAGSP